MEFFKKYSYNQEEDRKKENRETNEKQNKQNIKRLNRSVITLNINGLSIPVKRQRLMDFLF